MIKVNLTSNAGFIWHQVNDCWIKGAICDLTGNAIDLNTVVSKLKNVQTAEDLKQIVINLRGIFLIVIWRDEKVFAVSDITRTFPLFYFLRDKNLQITDNIWTFSTSVRKCMSEEARSEFLCTGYTIGNKTVYDSISQIQAAEILEFNHYSCISIEYWNYLGTSILDNEPQLLQKKALTLIEKSMQRLINSLDGKTALVPLSGGYDSRLILASLKKLRYKKVQCYTYGDPKSKDAKIAKEIAIKLGYPICFVSLTPQFIKTEFELNLLKKYMKFAFNGVSVPHLQDFLVVKYLNKKNLIPADSVFIPGHSGDIFAGTHIVGVGENCIRKDVENAIIKKHFWLSKHSRRWTVNYNNSAPPFSNMENWSWKERQSKFIVNSIRTYEFFGYESRIPLWDIDIASFYKNVPLRYKNRRVKKTYSVETNLYDSTCHIIFEQVGLKPIKRNQDALAVRALRRILSIAFNVDGVNNIDQIARCFKKEERIDFSSHRFNGCIAELQLYYLDQGQVL